MNFAESQPIYMQIGDYICANILRGHWQEGDKIPSIRELAVDVEVNPNTVVRTYAYLQERGIISNQRGIGYFVAEGGYEKTRSIKKDDFIQRALPGIFRTMQLLEMTLEDIRPFYLSYAGSDHEHQ